MEQVTVSSDYRIVIPRAVRERAEVRPGQRLVVSVSGRVISLYPCSDEDSMLGAFPDLPSFAAADLRDKADRVNKPGTTS